MILSVTIPTYNRVNYLKSMLKSVIDQIVDNNLFDEVEVIISDNCSTDSTSDYIKEVIANYGNIQIVYNRNVQNIGVVKNIVELVKLAKGKFWMFYGDDDLMYENSLVEIIACLKKNIETPVFVFKHYGYTEIETTEKISIYQCASRYFYYMGNACTAVDTSLSQSNIEQYYDDIVSTCWPQTHIMYLSMYGSPLELPVMISDITVYDKQEKDNNNVPNAFYYFDSNFYALIRLAQLISKVKDKNFYKKVRTGIPILQFKKYFRYCGSLIKLSKFTALQDEIADYNYVLKESLQTLKLRYKMYVYPVYFFNLVPSNIYISLFAAVNSLLKTIKGNGYSLSRNYRLIREEIDKVRADKLDGLKKKHAIRINRGDW
jgi:glycosyltransferase involved in cell wall biosynthesis